MLVAIRDNDERCSYLGIDPQRVKILLIGSHGPVAALAGFGYVGFSAVVAPENRRLRVRHRARGLGRARRPRLADRPGARRHRHRLVSAYLSSSLPFVWELIVGVDFVLVIVVLPGGLLGGLRDLAGVAPPASGGYAAARGRGSGDAARRVQR